MLRPTTLPTANKSLIGSCTSAQLCNSPHWLQWGALNWPPKLGVNLGHLLPLRQSATPSNTPIPRVTPLIIPNSIWIHSVVLPQYIFRTDRQTDRTTDSLCEWLIRIRRMLAILIKSDALIVKVIRNYKHCWVAAKLAECANSLSGTHLVCDSRPVLYARGHIKRTSSILTVALHCVLCCQ